MIYHYVIHMVILATGTIIVAIEYGVFNEDYSQTFNKYTAANASNYAEERIRCLIN